MKIAALFVSEKGPYFGRDDIDFWGESRDARKYDGPYPVIAHPPCERWGRYWSGGPSAKIKRKLGDDDGCFSSALESVRRYGGVLEHPQASHAWKKFGLIAPPWRGGWVPAGDGVGFTCCVAQGYYGHRAQKMTWLYVVRSELPELIWGPKPGCVRLDQGFHSKEERARAIKTVICQRLSKNQRICTPVEFANVLIKIAQKVPASGEV